MRYWNGQIKLESIPIMQISNLNITGENFVVMGILNLTPDSFSDGGLYLDVHVAVARAQQMVEEGADIIDIGGESTRPGAQPLTAEEEVARVVPVIKALRSESDVVISIDTSKAIVMKAAIEAGANLINDVRALQEEGALQAAAEMDVPVCLMHMQGQPRSMQHNPEYGDVVKEVIAFLQKRIEVCEAAGINRDKIILDPGFGFGKALEHNLSLLKHLPEFVKIGLPVLVGISRKSMLGHITGADVEQRVEAGLATTVLGYQAGARIFRVHDVKETVEALKVCHAVRTAK